MTSPRSSFLQRAIQSTALRISCSGILAIFLALIPALAGGESQAQRKTEPDVFGRPFDVTTRIYEMKAKQGSYKDVTDQLFKLRTSSFTDEERIISNFAKVFPGFDFALLNSARLKVNRTSKGTTLNLGKNQNRSMDIVHYGANSPGVGNKPGTSLIVEVNLTVGRPEAISYGMQTVEAEDGLTYFFSPTKLKFAPADYSTFLRPGIPAKTFEGYDRFIVIATSVDLTEKKVMTRNLDAKQSLDLQGAATKKVMPELLPQVRCGRFEREGHRAG